MPSPISIIIHTQDASPQGLDSLLKRVCQATAHLRAEIIILDKSQGGAASDISRLTRKYAFKAFIRYIALDSLCLDPESLINQKARYPRRIILDSGRDYGPGEIEKALEKTDHPGDSTCRLLQDAPARNSFEPSTFHSLVQSVVEHEKSLDLVQAIQDSEKALQKVCSSSPAASELVSIIMPTHNRAGIIGQAVSSVLEQSYTNWELLICDDGSTDDTGRVIEDFQDQRIRYRRLPKEGAAAARNTGLALARGEFIAYLDSDNCWHPLFLETMLREFSRHPGRSAAYSGFLSCMVLEQGGYSALSWETPEFDPERLLQTNFIDLNTFVHRRELSSCLGGFPEHLCRLQDYELILKFTWLRDPLVIKKILCLYQKNPRLKQITDVHGKNTFCEKDIQQSIQAFFGSGLPTWNRTGVKSVTIISWDACRNHFAKPFSLAEALSRDYDVQLISFRFFDQELFKPLQDRAPGFETLYLPGTDFPDFFASMDQALDSIRGEVIYAVKPRLPSLGLALMAAHRKKIPIILEVNDLETVVNQGAGAKHQELDLNSLDPGRTELACPYSDLWSMVMHSLAGQVPVIMTQQGAGLHFRQALPVYAQYQGRGSL